MTKKEKENEQLVAMFGQIQKKETGAIASVLSDRLQDMETEKQGMRETNIKLTNEIRDVRKKMKKYETLVNKFSNI